MEQLYKDLYVSALMNEIGAEQPLIDLHRILNKYAEDVLDPDEESLRIFLNGYIRRRQHTK